MVHPCVCAGITPSKPANTIYTHGHTYREAIQQGFSNCLGSHEGNEENTVTCFIAVAAAMMVAFFEHGVHGELAPRDCGLFTAVHY